MRDLAILGAGALGGTLAHAVARTDAASAIRLIDDAGQVAAGKALDIMQAAPIEQFATILTGHQDIVSGLGASVVVLADRVNGGEWLGDDALLMLKRLRRSTEESVVICAGASHREIVERGVRELGYRRERLFGTAPEALIGAVRALVALEADGSPRDVALTVLGVPPSQLVIPWGDATIGGRAAVSVLTEPMRRRLTERTGKLWPPGPLALALAAAKAVRGVLGGSRQLIGAFVSPDDSAGRRERAAASQVRLDVNGIARIETPTLSVHDRVALDNATLL
jgi:malate/lactate dehydrogenase